MKRLAQYGGTIGALQPCQAWPIFGGLPWLLWHHWTIRWLYATCACGGRASSQEMQRALGQAARRAYYNVALHVVMDVAWSPTNVSRPTRAPLHRWWPNYPFPGFTLCGNPGSSSLRKSVFGKLPDALQVTFFYTHIHRPQLCRPSRAPAASSASR